MSIASDTKVFVVVMFDRAARVLFGCSADEFFDFAKIHPFAGTFPFSHFLLMFFLWRKFSLNANPTYVSLHGAFPCSMNKNDFDFLIFS